MKDRLRSDSLHKKITLLPKLGSEVPPQAKGLKFGIPAIKKQSVARVLRCRCLRVTRPLAWSLALVEVRVSRVTVVINAIVFAILELFRILIPAPAPAPIRTRRIRVTRATARRLARGEVSGRTGTITLDAILFAILELIRTLGAFGAAFGLYLVFGFVAEHGRCEVWGEISCREKQERRHLSQKTWLTVWAATPTVEKVRAAKAKAANFILCVVLSGMEICDLWGSISSCNGKKWWGLWFGDKQSATRWDTKAPRLGSSMRSTCRI